MSDILYNSSKVQEFENFMAICDMAGEERSWGEQLWQDLLFEADLYEEYRYYMTHHCIQGDVKCCGYSLLDLFIWQMDHDNLLKDTGKNTAESCNKESMVLRSFRMMLDMKKNPESYLRKLDEGRGMDKF